MSLLLDGKKLAAEIRRELADEVAAHIKAGNPVPTLAVVLVGDDSASQVYVRNKQQGCTEVGIGSKMFVLLQTTTTEELLAIVHRLNTDDTVHGILVQLPLPAGIDEAKVLDTIAPSKDVDAFHAENVGLLSQGRPRFLPCTPFGIMEILRRYSIPTTGKRVVVLGRSNIVGKPMASLLVQKGADATVTMCHSRSQNLEEITRQADILIVAIGQAKFVKAGHVKPGACVIDVGMNRTETGRLCGDVDFDTVAPIAGSITPVPGGVGPLTVTMLLKNTLTAAKKWRGASFGRLWRNS